MHPSSYIETAGAFSHGILAVSRGADGGDGGDAGAAIYSEGGNGGVGGMGREASVLSNTHITTSGDWAAGIAAASLGGAGGEAGFGGSLGGQGGDALGSGPGGPANVMNFGTIETAGADSHGIFAQSVGGFAGGAGGAGGLFAWGGSANSAGDGHTVSVWNSGVITTGGDRADSIFAQSVGGGGGNAGIVSGLLAIGGTGAAGGNGNTVTVTNSGLLQTVGDESRGILAQSIGGGGGAGGSTYGLLNLFNIGGDGGSMGNGGDVTVDNSGAITTVGDHSSSILAQSVGGGGGLAGSGGTGVSFFLATGGAGGSGGNVTVHNSAALKTSGMSSSGILAQSIGGGGGVGGGAYAAGFAVGLSIGGDSALGGDGGQVNVYSGATSITTAGDLSHGIHAMSLGGGGGSGGIANTFTAGAYFSLGIAAGGRGGGGGDGGLVNLTSDSQITTQGERAHGLYAESIGGGGGSGGRAKSTVAGGSLPLPGPAFAFIPSLAASVSVGGSGGVGGSGDKVTVTSTGDISTSGGDSLGIFAQSVGGGGGSGGNSTATTVAVNSYALSIAVGGSGGVGGDGDDVDVTSSGNIATQGDFAYGILGQSIGGGGGRGGNSKTLLVDFELPTGWEDLIPQPDLNITMSLGGASGAGGHGGLVTIKNDGGQIDTKGSFAHGILAQSIGGGGGVGGDSTNIDIEVSLDPWDYHPLLGFMNVGGKFLLGGSGGAAGHGGGVSVDNQGNISTEGHFAGGILAQSIGGGGGAGGYVYNDIYRFTSPQSALTLEGAGGNGGNGSGVNVHNSGDITTSGFFAHGILAQSIGGGGGFGGISETSGFSSLSGFLFGVEAENTDFGVGFAGSAGGSGSAGAVTVWNLGTITTHGDGSHGILAQSVTLSGTTGSVNVLVDGDSTANGMDSDGIRAESIGGTGHGDITIHVNGGTVRGGSGAGSGVRINGGRNNTLTNDGSLSALSGRAIFGSSSNDIVNNNGIITGSVDLGTGVNAFNNNLAGTFNAGATVNLGAGNTLTNDGIFSPGGSGSVLDTIIACDFIQSTTGHLDIEIGGFNDGEYDFLNITETASLGGNINFSFLPGYDIVTDVDPGETWELTFLTAGSIGSFNSTINYNFASLPYFQFNVLQRDSSLYLQATNLVPVPGAFLLGCLGLSFAGLKLRRRREL